jgi:RimJ/RimL family protein N-acetyltransferase
VELKPNYPVLTKRLALRPLSMADADALLSYRSLPDVCRYVPFEPMTAKVVAEKIETTWARRTIDDEGQHLNLGVELRDTGELVGDVMLAWHSREHGRGEIGYVFHPDHGGRGYATEAMHAILHLGFDDLGLHRVIARIDARNDASGRVCERLAMRAEAHLIQNEWFKGEWTDEVDYGLLNEEWHGRVPIPGCDRCGR